MYTVYWHRMLIRLYEIMRKKYAYPNWSIILIILVSRNYLLKSITNERIFREFNKKRNNRTNILNIRVKREYKILQGVENIMYK